MSVASEEDLIRWLRSACRRRGNDLLGDDAAFLTGLPADLAVTTDQQIEGVHLPPGMDPAIAARRLLAVNLSDLAAVGGRPLYAFLTLGLPEEYDARRFLRSLLDRCEGLRLDLAGGDVSKSERFASTMTLVGRRPRRGRWVRRDAGRPADRLWLGGPVGESSVGRLLVGRGASLSGSRVHLPDSLDLSRPAARAARRAVRRHLLPQPQLELGQWLARRKRATAIDVSDGLGLDLTRLCRASGVGARIEADLLPFPAALAAVAGDEARQHALAGGEDYVLLFALPPSTRPPATFKCSRIGRLTEDRAIRLVEAAGERDLPPAGWDHLGPVR